MPPFYIGSSFIRKVKNGYRGSVRSIRYRKIWESELKKHPELFETKIIAEYETRKEAKDREEVIHRALNVHKNPLYVNMATANGIFGCDDKWSKERKKKHSKILKEAFNNHDYKKRCSVHSLKLWRNKEHQKKMSNIMKKRHQNGEFKDARKGEKNPMFGKTHSLKTKQLQREAKLGVLVGDKNGMYRRAHSECAKKSISEKVKGTSWIHHPLYGTRRVHAEEKQQLLNEGWILGRI
jgi:hypothetical protein